MTPADGGAGLSGAFKALMLSKFVPAACGEVWSFIRSAGRVVTSTHFGPYARLGDTHSEVRQWCAEHGHRLSCIRWEVYGHWDESWNADPSKIRTDVFHLLDDQRA